MLPSQNDFINFYQNAVFELGMGEFSSILGLFYVREDENEKLWDKHALEAAWRLGKSGIANMHDIEENDPIFLNLASTPSPHQESNWMCTILDPTQLAIDLRKKYALEDDGPFNPAFCEELCRIFEENNVGFDVPCPYVPNWENQGKYPWPYR